MVLRTIHGLNEIENAVVNKLRQLQEHGYGKMEIAFHDHKLLRLSTSYSYNPEDLIKECAMGSVSLNISSS